MEEIESEDFSHLSNAAPIFEENKFVKMNTKFFIHDTIEEHSEEISYNSLKPEVPKIAVDCIDSNCIGETLQSSKSDESSVASTVISVDKSYLLDCEKKVLEYSSSDDDRNQFTNKNVDHNICGLISRKLKFQDCTISTPPNELRQQINALRDEIAESHEFHDLEIKILMENLEENHSKNYVDLIEKYSTLMELYTSLKKEYESYRNEQENFKQEIHSKTTDYLETLCSQIEASDGSLTFSDASFASFNAEIKSSTMIENDTEKEITLNNNMTLTKDPLSLTNDNTFKTPKITPLRSCKKLLNLDFSTTKPKVMLNDSQLLKDVLIKREDSFQFKSKLLTKITELQTSLYNKVNEIKDLEERLCRVENSEEEIRGEYDRRLIELEKENEDLKKSFATKNMELEELTQRLVTESVALNPLLVETLAEESASEILSIFIKNIMDNCKNVKDELIKKYDDDKANWEKLKQIDSQIIEELQIQTKNFTERYEEVKDEFEKLKDKTVLQEKEIMELKSCQTELCQVKENFQGAQQMIMQLKKDLKIAEDEKVETLNKNQHLEETIAALETQIKSMAVNLENFQNINSCFEEKKLENVRHLQQIKDLENMVTTLKNELTNREALMNHMHQTTNDGFLKILEALGQNKESITHLYLDINETQKEKRMALYNEIKPSLELADNSEVLLAIIDQILFDCCTSVRHSLQEKFLDQNKEWEKQTNENQKLILEFQVKTENLKHELEGLQEKLNEMDELKKAYEESKEKIKENEFIILKKNEEIDCLKSEKEHESEKIKISGNFSELQDEIQKLQCQLNYTDGYKEEILAESRKLKDEIAVLRSEIDEKNDQLKTMETAVFSAEKLKLINTDLMETFKKSEEVNNDLRQELEALKNENFQWESEKKNDLDLIESLQKELNVLKGDDEKMGIVDKCVKLEEVISVLEAEVNSKENHLNDLQKTLAECCETNENLKLMVKELEKKSILKEDELMATKKNLLSNETLLDEISSLKKERNELQNIFSFFESNKKTIMDYCFENYSNKNDLNDSKLNVLSNELDPLFKNLNEFNTEAHFTTICELIFDSCKSVRQALISNFAEKEVNWQREKETDLTTIENLQTHLNSVRNELINNEEKLKNLENAKELQEAFKQKFEEAENMIVIKNNQIADLETINSKNCKMQDEFNLAQETIAKLNFEINEVRESKVEITNNCLKLEKANKELETELQTKAKDFDELFSLNQQIKMDNENLKQLTQQSEDRINYLQKELAILRLENNQCNEAIEVFCSNKNVFSDWFSNLSCLVDLKNNSFQSLLDKFELTNGKETVKILLAICMVVLECCSSVKNKSENLLETERIAWEKENKCALNLVEQMKNESELYKKEFIKLIEKLKELKEVEHKVFSTFEQEKEIFPNILKDHELNLNIDNKTIETADYVSKGKEIVQNFEKHLFTIAKDQTDLNNNIQKSKEIICKLEEEVKAKENDLIEMKSEVERLKNLVQQSDESINNKKNELGILQKKNEAFQTVFDAFRNNKKILTDFYCDLALHAKDFNETDIETFLNMLLLNNGDLCFENDCQRYIITIKDLITDCCNGIKNEALKALKLKNMEWESEKKKDYPLIESLFGNANPSLRLVNILKNSLALYKTKIKEFQSFKDSNVQLQEKSDDVEMKECKEIFNSSLEEAQNTNIEGDLAKVEKIVGKVCAELMVTDNCELIDKTDWDLTGKKLEEARLALQQVIEEKELFSTNLEKFKLSNEEFSQEVKNLKTVIKELEMALQEAKNENSLREKEKKDNLNCIENLQEEVRNLRVNIEENEMELKKLETFRKLSSALEEEMAEIKGILKNKVEEIDCLDLQKTEINDDLKATRETIVKLESELIAVENCKKEIEEKCQKMENVIHSKEILLKDLEIKLLANEKVKFENESLKNQVIMSENRIQGLETELSFAKKKLELTETLESEIKLIKNENNAFKSLFEALKKHQESFDNLYFELSSNDHEINDLPDRIKTSIKKSLHDCSEIENYLNLIIDTILNCCLPFQNDLKKVCLRMKEKENSAENLKAMVDSLSNVNNSLELKMTEMLKEIEELKNEKEDLSKRVRVLEEHKKDLTDLLVDIQSSLGMPKDTVSKILSGNFENCKIFSEYINKQMKSEMETWKIENNKLKMNNNTLKEKVKEFSQIIDELSNQKVLDNSSLNNSRTLKSLPSKTFELCNRRLDKLEELNQNLTELITYILTITKFSNIEKLKFMSVRDYPNITKKVNAHFDKMLQNFKDLEEVNQRLDEECDSYAKTIKDLKKEAVNTWKSNKDKVDVLNSELKMLKEENKVFENEKSELLAKVAKLESECLKWKNATAKPEDSASTCNCSNELKKVYDLKRTILVKEQKILELQDLENQNSVYKSQIKYLENALEQEKKKIRQEKEKIKKLQSEIEELTRKEPKQEKKTSEESDLMEELRVKGSLTGGIVQEFVDKEKMRKLSKEIGILKELCRARYVEIRRLEVENASLKNSTTKNLNQMDSPLRVKTYNTRSKVNAVGKETVWKVDVKGKENRVGGDASVL